MVLLVVLVVVLLFVVVGVLGSRRAERRRVWPGPVPAPPAPDVPQPWQALRDRIAAALPALPVGATLVVSDDGTESHLYVRFQHLGDVMTVDASGSQAWGGPWPVEPAQDERMHELGWQRPADREGAFDRTQDYRLDVALGEPGTGLDASLAATLAAHGVVALATLGGAPEHAWQWEQYA